MTQKLNTVNGSYKLICNNYTEMYECEVCKFPLRDDKDMLSVKKLGACTDCIDTYYYQNENEWKSGWRPKKNKI